MFSPVHFKIGDLVIQQLTDPKDPATKISRRGIISEVAVSTIVVKWSKDPNFAPIDDNIRMLTSTVRRMILNGSFQHFPTKV